MVMKMVRMRDGRRGERFGGVYKLLRTVISTSLSSALARGMGVEPVAEAGMRIGSVGECRQGSRDRDVAEKGIRSISRELRSGRASALREREDGVLGWHRRAILAAEEGESLFRGRRGDSRVGFGRGEGESDRPLEVEELDGEDNDREEEEEEEVPVEYRRCREVRRQFCILRSGSEWASIVGGKSCDNCNPPCAISPHYTRSGLLFGPTLPLPFFMSFPPHRYYHR